MTPAPILPLIVLGAVLVLVLVVYLLLRRAELRAERELRTKYQYVHACIICQRPAVVLVEGKPGWLDGHYCQLHNPAWREPRPEEPRL